MNVCPACNGAKIMRGLGRPMGGGPCVPVTIPCIDCGGKGEVDDLELRRLWRDDAATLLACRRSRRLTLGKAARWVGVTVAEWSAAEGAHVDPGPLLGKVQEKAREGFKR